jgi:uncharacterized protein (TIGR02452 family)
VLIERDFAAQLGHETVGILGAGSYTAPSGARIDLSAKLERCRQATVEYPPDASLVAQPQSRQGTAITVENATVLDVGRRLAQGGPVAALNFAAAGHPGGGFLSGARAQEESIARSSGLFHAIDDRRMYAFHRERVDPMYSDWVIYSPEVPVFRTDDGRLLERPWNLSILTCAAVNGVALERHAPHRMKDVPAVMRQRTARVLTVAAAHDVRQLILGAWGCGAFGLDPHMMAGIFHEALAGPFDGVFEDVVFAITDWSPERRFIGPFAARFGE